MFCSNACSNVLHFSDIDECAEGSHKCDVHATCTNTVGSHECTCNLSHTGNGTFCRGEGGQHTDYLFLSPPSSSFSFSLIVSLMAVLSVTHCENDRKTSNSRFSLVVLTCSLSERTHVLTLAWGLFQRTELSICIFLAVHAAGERPLTACFNECDLCTCFSQHSDANEYLGTKGCIRTLQHCLRRSCFSLLMSHFIGLCPQRSSVPI